MTTLNGVRPSFYPILPPRHAAMAVVVKGQVVARVANEQMARLAREIVTLFNQGRPDLSKSPIRVRIIVVHDDNGKPYYYIQRMGW